jgi:hypothetical protein
MPSTKIAELPPTPRDEIDEMVIAVVSAIGNDPKSFKQIADAVRKPLRDFIVKEISRQVLASSRR